MSDRKHKPNRESPEDREFEALRRRWAAGEQIEPPDMLDQAVLNAARRAIDDGAQRPGWRWLGTLATAAVIVLAVSLVVRQGPREPSAPAAPSGDERELEPQRPAARTVAEPSAEGLSSRRKMESTATAPSSAPAAVDQARMADEAPAEETRKREFDPQARSKPGSQPPDEWIRQILALKARGDTERLSLELQAFERAYPDYELPAELKPRSP